MTAGRTGAEQWVDITVELFGTARMNAGVSLVPLRVGSGWNLTALAGELAKECPALLGNGLFCDDGNYGQTAIQPGYSINRNGLEFLGDDGDTPLDLKPGDSLLLLSNQAGG